MGKGFSYYFDLSFGGYNFLDKTTGFLLFACCMAAVIGTSIYFYKSMSLEGSGKEKTLPDMAFDFVLGVISLSLMLAVIYLIYEG
tara:strand:+ start:280 stop:534 length:255 start_codon:yes stop_codon:yes gene_type:complete